jgi:hypothetical protein
MVVEAVERCCDYGLMSEAEFMKYLDDAIGEVEVKDLDDSFGDMNASEIQRRMILKHESTKIMREEVDEGSRRVPDPFPFWGARISIKQPKGVRDDDVVAWVTADGDEVAYRRHFLFGSQAIAARGPNLALWVQLETAFIANAMTPHLRIAIAQQRRKDVGTGKEEAHR